MKVQRNILLSLLLIFIISNLILNCLVFAQEKVNIEGIWKGKLQLDFLFKIDRARDGSLTASFNTPLQEVYNVPIKHVNFVNDSLYLGIELSDVNKSHFTGVFNRNRNIIEGYFNDGKHNYPMTLEPSNTLLAQMVPRIDSKGNRIKSYRYQMPQKLDDGWETAHLADTCIDTAKITEVIKKILKEEYKQIHSMLIVKNGKLVVDEYFYGFTNKKIHFIASVTKSVTNSLIGIAVDKGIIKDIQEPVCTYFPEYSDLLCTGDKKQILLYHLLSMSAGLEWDEQSYNYLDSRNSSVAMSSSSDGLRYLFGRKLLNKPGENTVYNSGLPVALSEIIRKESGLTIDKFAEENLFSPLGIKDYFWEKHPDGTFHAGGGLSIMPRDMAKLGLLYMNKGKYLSECILSEGWFEYCSRRYMSGKGPKYWNHWTPYIEFIKDVPVEIYSAGGLGGQFIYAIPKLDAVVIFTSDFFGFPNQIQEIMRNYLLPALIVWEEKGNYTSKEIKILNNYNWQYHWISEMACIEAGLKVMDIDCSSSWLYGTTGNAFLININDDVSVPSLADALSFPNMQQSGLGFQIETIECSVGAPDFIKKQREAWDKICQALDRGRPCYGFQLDWIPEYYLIFGYDQIGYYYKGIDYYAGKGPKLWNEAGINGSKKLIMKIISPANRLDDNILIREALQFAVNYYGDKKTGQNLNYRAGPDAYEVWAQALQNGKANGYGNALNAATFAECRRYAVGFLEECKSRSPARYDTLFDVAISHYRLISQKLSSVEKLFPFFIPDEMKIANVSDPDKCRQAAELLLEAKAAETEGIKWLGLILEDY